MQVVCSHRLFFILHCWHIYQFTLDLKLNHSPDGFRSLLKSFPLYILGENVCSFSIFSFLLSSLQARYLQDIASYRSKCWLDFCIAHKGISSPFWVQLPAVSLSNQGPQLEKPTQAGQCPPHCPKLTVQEDPKLVPLSWCHVLFTRQSWPRF